MITQADKQFKKALLRRWETIINRINKRKSKQYDFRSIKIDLQRNLPTDKGTETDRWLKLRGLLPDQTIIDNLPDDLDSISELEKMREQDEEKIKNNIESMQKIGQEKMIDNETEKENKSKVQITDLTDEQKAQKLTATNKKDQQKEINEQLKKE